MSIQKEMSRSDVQPSQNTDIAKKGAAHSVISRRASGGTRQNAYVSISFAYQGTQRYYSASSRALMQ